MKRKNQPELALPQTQPIAGAGEYWMARKEGGVLWPVVICDEEMAQTFFKGKRPVNALQADGTWKRGFMDFGTLIEQRCFPALYLGIMKFCWVPWKRFEPIDFQIVHIIRKSLTEKDQILAYDELLDGDLHNLSYWKDKLFATKLQEEQAPMHENKKGLPKMRKQKDDDNDDFHLTSTPISIKVKKENVNKVSQVVNTMSQAENDALYQDPGVLQLERTKHNPFDCFSLRPTPSVRSSSTIAQVRGSPKVAVYIGNPWAIFDVSLESLPASPVLQHELRHDCTSGYRIMSPLLSTLTKQDFQPVTEFLARREYHPNILDQGTPFARLENITTEREERNEMLRCGVVYCVSYDLDIPDLGRLAIQKLQALEPVCGPVKEFLTVTGVIFSRSDRNNTKDRFWELVIEETQSLVDVLGRNEELAKGVFGVLSGRGGVGNEGKELVRDERVKREGFLEDGVLDEI